MFANGLLLDILEFNLIMQKDKKYRVIYIVLYHYIIIIAHDNIILLIVIKK